jgi:hypothetical protein
MSRICSGSDRINSRRIDLDDDRPICHPDRVAAEVARVEIELERLCTRVRRPRSGQVRRLQIDVDQDADSGRGVGEVDGDDPEHLGRAVDDGPRRLGATMVEGDLLDLWVVGRQERDGCTDGRVAIELEAAHVDAWAAPDRWTGGDW